MDHERRTQFLIILAAMFGVAVVAGIALVGSRWNGAIPDGAGSAVLARTVMTGENGTDGTRSPDGGPTPQGVDCHEFTDNESGPMYACWETYRDPNDGDAEKDYFHLYVHGSYGGETGTGVNWLVVRADLVDAAAGGAYAHWPNFTYTGACQEMPVDVPLLVGTQLETLCGTTKGSLDATTWTQTLTWTCEGCLLGNHEIRSFAMYGFVGVPEGVVPAWDIVIDYGT